MSVRSTALEPPAGTPLLRRAATVYGLVILLVLFSGVFSALLPNTFPTWLNFRLNAGGRSVLILLALAVTVPMIAGKIDLSVGYAVGLWHILALTFQTRYHLPWWLACLAVLALGALVGAFNALLVELAQVDAFIATLATGLVLNGFVFFHTNGEQQLDRPSTPTVFKQIGNWSLGGRNGVPGPFLVAVALGLVMYVVLEYLPIGRYLYAVGANPRSAELAGIPRRKYIVGAFIASGVITAFAGIVLQARQNTGQANVGPDLLFPALVAAFLGSTTIRPGRVNPLGTLAGIAISVVGLSGLIQQFPGRDNWLTPMFNGLTLMAAIVIASTATRRRLNAAEKVGTDRAAAPAAAPVPRNAEPAEPAQMGTTETDGRDA